MRKGYLFLMSAVCVLLAVWLAAAAVGIYLDGSARRAEDPAAAVYTREIVAERLTPAMPVLIVIILLLAVGRVFGFKTTETTRPAETVGTVKQYSGPKHKNRIRAAIIAAALILIVAGILNGSARDVLVKAITICTECIGLG